MRSFAQILKSNQERSTFVLETKTSDEFNQLSAGGKLFLRARDKNSIVIATAQFDNYNTKELSLLLREQYPEGLGLRTRDVNKTTKYLEVSFRTAAEREAALKKNFVFQGKNVEVSRTYPKDTTIVRVSVNNLPYEDEKTLKENMSKIFAEYGEILEMGVLFSVHGHWFTGRGFVTLNLLQGKTYRTLIPQIPSWEEDETLKLTFTGMKPTCSRCHVTDHVFGNCPIMTKQVKSCFICGKTDHLQAGCPKAWWNMRKQAKMSTHHQSPTRKAPKDKADLSTSKDIAKEVTPVKDSITSIVPRIKITSVDLTTMDTPPIEQAKKEDKQEGNEVAVVIEDSKEVDSEHQYNTVKEVLEPLIVNIDDGVEENDEDIPESGDEEYIPDLDMSEAEKEATATGISIEDVVKQMKHKLALQKKLKFRKTKKLNNVKGIDKDLVCKATRSRTGGSAIGKKQSATKSSSK
jgi:hypothetical protein